MISGTYQTIIWTVPLVVTSDAIDPSVSAITMKERIPVEQSYTRLHDLMRKGVLMPDKPSERLITIQVTPNELIAIGHLIYTYRLRLKSTPNYMQGQRELLALLESFQRRVAGPTRTALDLSATSQPWLKSDVLPRSFSSVTDISDDILRWIGRASQRVVARLKNFFLLSKKSSRKGS